jgi:hypothetical protein
MHITRKNRICKDLFIPYIVQVSCMYNVSHITKENLDYVKNIYLFDACFKS